MKTQKIEKRQVTEHNNPTQEKRENEMHCHACGGNDHHPSDCPVWGYRT